MYAELWRSLPGPTSVRAVLALVLVALAVAACFTWLFPWVSTLLPFTESTVAP